MKELIDALIKAQAEINHATKDGSNPYFKSGYATLEQVITTVKPALLKHGILFQQKSHLTDQGACVETFFYGHGYCLETGPVLIIADKRDPQAFGSALTYAKRYSLSLACGIGHQADDDAEQAMQRGKASPRPAVKAPEARYKLRSGETVLVTAGNEAELINACRRHLANKNDPKAQKIYESSAGDIKQAMEASSGDLKRAFKTLVDMYGETA